MVRIVKLDYSMLEQTLGLYHFRQYKHSSRLSNAQFMHNCDLLFSIPITMSIQNYLLAFRTQRQNWFKKKTNELNNQLIYRKYDKKQWNNCDLMNRFSEKVHLFFVYGFILRKLRGWSIQIHVSFTRVQTTTGEKPRSVGIYFYCDQRTVVVERSFTRRMRNMAWIVFSRSNCVGFNWFFDRTRYVFVDWLIFI